MMKFKRQRCRRRPCSTVEKDKIFPLVRSLLAVALGIAALPCSAATCSLSAQGVIFGSYDVFNDAPLDSTGNVGVTCDAAATYAIALSPGAGSYTLRSMASGVHSLNYNLYTDAARTIFWGDGTSGTATVSSSGTGANHAVYARIPARQNVHVGSYIDTVTVTLNF